MDNVQQTVHKIESDKIKPPASAVPSIPPAPIVKTEVVVPASIDTDSKTPSKESGTAAKAPGNAGAASVDSAVVKVTGDRPLVLYAYSQTDAAQANLEFFIKHALNKRADFKFIINGDDAKAREIIPKEDNIQIITRPNDCYDLGAYAEVLTKDDLWKKYKKFITINASLRGPFMPAWAQGCWMDMYLGKITDEVKVSSYSLSCVCRLMTDAI